MSVWTDKLQTPFRPATAAEASPVAQRQSTPGAQPAPQGTPAQPPHATTSGIPSVSVIIPVFNEEANIGRCLQALKEMQERQPPFEVIVADNGSTDRTLEIVRSYEDALELRVVQLPDTYISERRNLAASMARGDVLAFLDADCLPPADWLKRGLELLTDNSVVGCHYKIPPNSRWVARVWYHSEATSKVGETSYLPSGDLIVRRSTFFRVGSFDPNLETNEDYEFCVRARRNGIKIIAYAELGVIHYGTPQTVREFYEKQHWHGTHVLKVFLKNIPYLYNIKPLLFAAYILLCLLGLAIAAVVGHVESAVFFGAAKVLAPIVLGIRLALMRGRVLEVPYLAVLFLVFGLARASCLLKPSNWRGRSLPSNRHG